MNAIIQKVMFKGHKISFSINRGSVDNWRVKGKHMPVEEARIDGALVDFESFYNVNSNAGSFINAYAGE